MLHPLAQARFLPYIAPGIRHPMRCVVNLPESPNIADFIAAQEERVLWIGTHALGELTQPDPFEWDAEYGNLMPYTPLAIALYNVERSMWYR